MSACKNKVKYRRDISESGENYSPEREAIANDDSQINKFEDYSLERSISMPAITSSGDSTMMMNNDGGIDRLPSSKKIGLLSSISSGKMTGTQSFHTASKMADEMMNVISDEVIQELGMWEQVINDEKKDGDNDDEEKETYEEEKVEAKKEEYGEEEIRSVSRLTKTNKIFTNIVLLKAFPIQQIRHLLQINNQLRIQLILGNNPLFQWLTYNSLHQQIYLQILGVVAVCQHLV